MKIVKRVLGILLITVLASSLSILTTGVIVNAYIQSVLSSFDIKLDSPVSGFSGVIRSLSGSNSVSTTEMEEKSVKNSNPPEEDALPVMGNITDESVASAGQNEDAGGKALDQQLVMTPEAMRDLKESLPSGEKINIFNILMNKLPQEEMQKISTAMEDGLTESEVKTIQEVILNYVTDEEYETLMKVLTPNSVNGQ